MAHLISQYMFVYIMLMVMFVFDRLTTLYVLIEVDHLINLKIFFFIIFAQIYLTFTRLH